jgi:hypothetical protein
MELVNENENINDENKKIHKIIIITYRLRENLKYIPSEEIIFYHIFENNQNKYIQCERIIVGDDCNSSFYGKLPIIYFDGRIVKNKNILFFLKDYFIKNSDKHFDTFFENLVTILSEQLRFSNENYYYWKLKEKIEKDKHKNAFNFFKYIVTNKNIKNIHYETLTNDMINNKLSNNVKEINFNENKSADNIVDAFRKIELLKSKIFFQEEKNILIKLVIYGFLTEDKMLFDKVKRPFLENLKYDQVPFYKNLFEVYYPKLEEYFNSIEKDKNKCINLEIKDNVIVQQMLKKYSMFFDPKKKKNFRTIEEIEITRSYQNNLFAIIIFCGVTVALFFISSRKK